MKVAIYGRYSTDLQDKTSIDGQIVNCEALAAREGLDIVARFRDEGRSGNDDQRDGYQAMLAALKRGEFIGIVCDETSRITRNQAELHRLTAELRFHDQFLITCDGIDTRSESSDLVLSVKAAIDQMEGRKIGYRTYRGLRERHKAGHSAGGRAFGYTSVEDGNYKRRVIDPEQAEIAREIFERYAAGEGATRIARDLNERRIPSPGSYWNRRVLRADGWMHTSIIGTYSKADGILRNPIYTGRIIWNRRKAKKIPGTARRIMKRRPNDEWIEYQDESLRIISDQLWSQVQTRLEAAREKAGKYNRGGRPTRYLLSGLITCASCGGHYVLRNGKAYSCSSHTNGRKTVCVQRKTLKRERLESALLQGIKAEFLAPGVVRELSKRVHAQLRQVKRPDMTGLKEELRSTDHQIGNVVDALADLGRSDALTAKLRKLEAKKAEIELKLSSQLAPAEIVPHLASRVRERIETLEHIPQSPYTNQDITDNARAALKGLLGNVTLIEEGDVVYADLEMGRACISDGNGGSIPPREAESQTRPAGGLDCCGVFLPSHTASFPR